ncbi:MAG: hypothetical protein EU536_02540 [Promethearchaeota archaeon]|nr:MAG: hypothetical protein EU536_02540 [Candidatus Lokiarchaeota archaeon]
MNSQNWRKFLFAFAVGGIIQFLILIGVAIWFYAGGTRLNPAAPGYSFLLNSWSDLGRTVAWSGEQNLVSQMFFSIAMVVWGLSFAPSVHALEAMIAKSKFSRKIGKVGISFAYVCVFALLAEVIFFPEDVYPQLHSVFAIIGYFGLFMGEVLFACLILLNETYPKKYALCFLEVGVVILLFFIFNNPLLQKAVTFSLSITTPIIFRYSWKRLLTE